MRGGSRSGMKRSNSSLNFSARFNCQRAFLPILVKRAGYLNIAIRLTAGTDRRKHLSCGHRGDAIFAGLLRNPPSARELSTAPCG